MCAGKKDLKKEKRIQRRKDKDLKKEKKDLEKER